MTLLLASTVISFLAAAADAAPPAGKSKPITRFTLRDTAGNEHTQKEWRQKKAIVLLFLGAECPVSNGYAPVMQRLSEDYASRDVAFYGIHVDPTLSAAAAAKHAQEYSLPFVILLDPEQSLATAVEARVTPGAIVLSPDGRVRYQGRIDNRFALDGKRRDVPTMHELVDALDAVLAGETPAVTKTEAFGCPLPTLREKQR